MNITRAILKLRIKYAIKFRLSPIGINNGRCMDFAAEIAKQGFGQDVWGCDLSIEWWSEIIQPFENDLCDFAEIHCFIMYDGKFYDSETPQGCNYPDQLLCYQRNIDMLTDIAV